MRLTAIRWTSNAEARATKVADLRPATADAPRDEVGGRKDHASALHPGRNDDAKLAVRVRQSVDD